MKYLYVDNFRGFSSTLIPIKKVNFLVGENSTGKTSLLSLLNLLCSLQFWVRQEFNTDQVELGNFKDIVSLEAQDKNYFRIGFFLDQLESKKNGTKSPILILMTFTESNDMPLLTRYNYLDNEAEYEIIFSESEEAIKYRQSSTAQNDYSPEGLLQKIKQWEREKGTKKGFKTLKGQELAGKTETLSAATYLVGMKYARELSPTQFKFFRDFAWIAPIRSKPRRTYDRFKYDFSPEGEHAPYLIKKILSDKRSSAGFLEFIRNFGDKSNLFSSINVNEFGMDTSSPFELKIKIAEKLININYVGYGVSQCLPFLVEMFSRNEGTWYAIQQPEVHLHPKAQAALGNLFYSLSISEDKNFLIETHSDYIIDRFRLNCRQVENKPVVDSQVLYFERTPVGNTVYPIEIDDGGKYSENQPETFRDFFIKEQLELLELD
jgi:predicted ATPase